MLSFLWRLLAKPKAKPGEIWWADVPYEDGPGSPGRAAPRGAAGSSRGEATRPRSKIRPCLIVRVRWGGYDVLKITSQDQSRRGDHIEIATRSWDRNAEKNSFLDLTDPIRVRERAVDNRAGALDAATWARVRKLHRI